MSGLSSAHRPARTEVTRSAGGGVAARIEEDPADGLDSIFPNHQLPQSGEQALDVVKGAGGRRLPVGALYPVRAGGQGD